MNIHPKSNAITAIDVENFFLTWSHMYVCKIYMKYCKMLTICLNQMKGNKNLDLVIHEEPSFSWEIEFSARL